MNRQGLEFASLIDGACGTALKLAHAVPLLQAGRFTCWVMGFSKPQGQRGRKGAGQQCGQKTAALGLGTLTYLGCPSCSSLDHRTPS